ncbi:type VII secretion protein EccB [Streptomyces sp. IBSBF 2435]|uniref:type VII secretion protein EccB n=1 Tax=Streptomyces sp. IBSBF 2435 TaxID=2903531 RepID=UPI002FDC4EED
MQSRRDQIQAHSFVMGRLTSAVLRVDLDGAAQPVARTSKGTLGGLMIAVLAGVIVALYGLVVPGGGDRSWEKPGTLVVDSGTGARYLYIADALHPVLNVTSARLFAGSRLTVKSVGTSALRGVTRGAPFGIADAPDALPPAGDLSRNAWSACVATRSAESSGVPQLVLGVGQGVRGRALTGGQAIVVSAPDGTGYLLWDGRRLRIDAAEGVTRALGYTGAAPVPVTSGFLDAVPAGPDLAPPDLAGLGDAGPELAGQPTRVGQLFTDQTGRHYVLTRKGLAPLTATVFVLLRGEPGIQRHAYEGGAVTVPTLGPDDFARNAAPKSTAASLAALGTTFPTTPPHAVTVGETQAVCANLRPSTGAVSSGIGVADSATVRAAAAPPGQGRGITPSCDGADLVAVKGGSGALVAVSPAGGGSGSTEYLVTDNGVKYSIPAGAAGRAGYTGSDAVTLPATVVALLPTGPSLDLSASAGGGVREPVTTTVSCGD